MTSNNTVMAGKGGVGYFGKGLGWVYGWIGVGKGVGVRKGGGYGNGKII